MTTYNYVPFAAFAGTVPPNAAAKAITVERFALIEYAFTALSVLFVVPLGASAVLIKEAVVLNNGIVLQSVVTQAQECNKINNQIQQDPYLHLFLLVVCS